LRPCCRTCLICRVNGMGEFCEVLIAISNVSGDGDARLEIGGFQRYTANHQSFLWPPWSAAIFLFGVDWRAHHAAPVMLLVAVAGEVVRRDNAAGRHR